MNKNKNPIKHIKFSETDYFKPVINAGGNSKPHKVVTSEFRNGLLNSIDKLTSEISVDAFSTGVAAAVVELEEKAIAKSNRPVSIFNKHTCPFFGDIGYSKFLIQINLSGLIALREKISTVKNKGGIKDLSAIKMISSYEPEINITEENSDISVRLFRFESKDENDALDNKFEEYIKAQGCGWVKHPSEVVRLYKVNANANEILGSLSSFVGIQSAISSRTIKIKPMVGSDIGKQPANMPPPDENKNYPIVAVVDSGVSLSPVISQWIHDRASYVAAPYKNDNHGTFVSGLISNGYNLNGKDLRFPTCQAKIFSVEVLGEENGDMYDILAAMREVAEGNPNIRVWNLSLGSSSSVSMNEISSMALMLDEFQDKYNCLCIVAAGNYEGVPREWPPNAILDDGISSPGDSVRSLTVGSLAHVDGFVNNDEPSHFSRKGPVSNYVQKPEVVHYGGNITIHGGQQIVLGVNSVGVNGEARHDIGTSFSTPIVSAIAANLFQQIGTKSTPSLIKSLIIHSANLGHSIDDEHKPYYGWGIPQSSERILSVQDYESTMVFEGSAIKSFEIEKLPFPIPECLRTVDRKVRAEFFITLVYQPELDPSKAFEYCQMDLNVGFGEIDKGKFKSRVPLQKGEHKFETELAKSGDKWSPVKVYQARFTKGVDIENWRLRVSVLDRDGYEATGVLVPFSIILTVRDIDREKPVYNEMARLMDNHNWEVSNLVVDTQIKI